MSDEAFKLPRSSYEELCKIITAYGRHDEPVDLKAISDLTAINSTIVSANNGFLIATGILTSGKAKQISVLGKTLAQSLEHEMPLEIVSAWRHVVLRTEFLSKMISAVKIRKGMDIDALQGHIAYSAGVPKQPQFMTGARTVADVLVASGSLKEQDGKLIYAEGCEEIPKVGIDQVLPQPEEKRKHGAQGGQTNPISPPLAIQLVVNLNITLNDLPGLGSKLRDLIADLKTDNMSVPAIENRIDAGDESQPQSSSTSN